MNTLWVVVSLQASLLHASDMSSTRNHHTGAQNLRNDAASPNGSASAKCHCLWSE